MDSKTVYSGQSLLDKAIECTGDIDNVFALAKANGINITDALQVGSVLKATEVTKPGIVELFEANNRPATDAPNSDQKGNYELPGGEFPISF